MASNGEALIGYCEADRKGFQPRDLSPEQSEKWDNESDTRFCIISMADGQIYTRGKSKKEIAKWLNGGCYRPTTLEEKYMKHRLVPEQSR
ncbi:hypothetical protein [Alterisphingorhabdus coralli]|uniref:Uncharacterized protein n=1 Tax=Alterisphingorhabdus coralli TaxID=3071408 RepID=A0AA97FB24_9SPHN|nr:hypothetical protein [Parasphingorhabdus sp. SCSIO 66989]WOE76347.1 hypothetical protein RB602_06440 [Parasphingorhabdus sp. SCSIO 66989]